MAIADAKAVTRSISVITHFLANGPSITSTLRSVEYFTSSKSCRSICRRSRGLRYCPRMTKSSTRDRLEQALARIADPAGEGCRACLTVYTEAARAAADAADLIIGIGSRRQNDVDLAGREASQRRIDIDIDRSELAQFLLQDFQIPACIERDLVVGDAWSSCGFDEQLADLEPETSPLFRRLGARADG